MATTMSRSKQLLLYCFAPIACSIVIGLILASGRVFHLHSTAFQFVISSVIASIFYYLLVLARPRDAYLALAFLFLLEIIIARSTRPALIVRDILAVAAIALSMLIYFRYFRHPKHLRYLSPPIVLAVIYGLVNLAASSIDLFIVSMLSAWSFRESFPSIALSAIFFGMVIGFAVGCGLALNDRFAPVATNT